MAFRMDIDSYVVQWYGAEPSNLSLFYYDHKTVFPGIDAILVGGYSTLANTLDDGLNIQLEQIVNKIECDDLEKDVNKTIENLKTKVFTY